MSAFHRAGHAGSRNLALLLIFVGFLLRVVQLEDFPNGLSHDEAVNAVDALHIAQAWNFPFYEDFGRPEPLYRYVLALGQLLFGPGVWSARLTSALTGVISLALAYWAVVRLLYDQAPAVRAGAALLACGYMTLALGHITLSRALYRGLLQAPFMFLSLGLMLRALRTLRHRHFIQAGIATGLGFYTYTAYFFAPLAFIPMALSLPLLRRYAWRQAWEGMILAAVVALLLVLPIGARLLQTPQAVIGRSGAAASALLDLSDSLGALLDQVWNTGDENPQYNVAQAPIIAAPFMPFALLGLLALLWRWRQPGSIGLLALLILTSLPPLLSDEVNHGLRTVGLAASLVLLIGLGAGLALRLTARWSLARCWMPAAFTMFMVALVPHAWQVYSAYWLQADSWPLWRVYGRELNHSEWFFRLDHRELARWITEQNAPLLLPLESLNQPTLRAWLARSHPFVKVAELQSPAPTADLLLPYSLERDSFLPATTQYALLDDGQIIILPPFDDASQQRIARASAQARALPGTGRIRPIARLVSAPLQLQYPAYEPAQLSYQHPLSVQGWTGKTWSQDGIFSVLWQADARLGHDYFTYLQILNQDYQVLAQAQDTQALRWVYPSTLWPVGQKVPLSYVTISPPAFEAGAYRLVVGAYPIFQPPLSAAVDGETALFPQAAWLKVAHPPVSIPDHALRQDTIFGQMIELLAVDIRQEGQSLQIDLYWLSLIDRPSLDATIFIHALDASGSIKAQQDTRPQAGRYPTFIWDAGEIVHTRHSLPVPDAHSLRIGLYEFVDGAPRNLFTEQGEALLIPYNSPP